MKPDLKSRRLFGITRSKGKMYELGLPDSFHIEVPADLEPQELFVLTVGTLGDVAAAINDTQDSDAAISKATAEDLGFSASFFDAFLESKFSPEVERDTVLLASAAYYLAKRPGSSLVLARRLVAETSNSGVDSILQWLLSARWSHRPENAPSIFGNTLEQLRVLVTEHFANGSGREQILETVTSLRAEAYKAGSSRQLLLIDLIAAIVRVRVAASAWSTLPRFSRLPTEDWAEVIRRQEFPKELWPSQILLGIAGIFGGSSGIVQMPTSAGKTRSIEMMLRSAFMSGRTKFAVVVAPFRALCHEIGASLRYAFREDPIRVNELSDAMQLDFAEQMAELFGSEAPTTRFVLVLTPEKLLYVLRNAPEIMSQLGMVVYDEGHQFDSGSRGITYELLLTEIKALLSPTAQTVLISAVIQNAESIAGWLIGESAKVVNGTELLPTARSVAFASWLDYLGQLMFFESNTYANPDYFVPRVIERKPLSKRRGERKERTFPEKGDAKDIALYLGLRLVPNGAVAVFCGRKDTAASILNRAIEIYDRGEKFHSAVDAVDPDELTRLLRLIDAHFGVESAVYRAAALGIFIHHGSTPHGLRLAVEYAMQQSLISFVICTSTLAQGVNLPIRYLIVSGVQQGIERIKVRDFQNLIGRAGRSGMHTEGLVIFADPAIFDKRVREPWRFRASTNLLSASLAESTTSSLLDIVAPIRSGDRKAQLEFSVDEMCNLLFQEPETWNSWAAEVVRRNSEFKFSARDIIADLRTRRRLVGAIESYLMANRNRVQLEEFEPAAEELASSTLAHYLATDAAKLALRELFRRIAAYVNQQEPTIEKQVAYSKTLLGVNVAKAVEAWVNVNRDELLTFAENRQWFEAVWPLFVSLSEHRFFTAVDPIAALKEMGVLWISGETYERIFGYGREQTVTKPWGEKRTQFTMDDVVDFCDNILGFECSLLLGAVMQFLFGTTSSEADAAPLSMFQKSLKYGIPDSLAISCYETGFADRVIAMNLSTAVRAEGFTGGSFAMALNSHTEVITEILRSYPSYFQAAFVSQIRKL